MPSTARYPALRESVTALAHELATFVIAKWSGDWAESPPQVGIHYNYWNLAALPGYGDAHRELSRVPGITEKYRDYGLEGLIGMLLERIVASVPSPSILEI